MEASPRAHGIYYRCPARTLAPGSPALALHPPAVYLREDPIRDAVNSWIGELFARENVDNTVAALLDSQQPTGGQPSARDATKKRLSEAEARLHRFQTAIEAGVDPAALVDAINAAQATRAAARAEVENAPAPNTLSAAEVYAMIDALGDVDEALSGARPESLVTLYQAVGLQVRYEPSTHVADVTIQPVSRVNSECVRGGT